MRTLTAASAMCLVLFTLQAAYGQVLPEPTVGENIAVKIDTDGTVYVTHELFGERAGMPVALLDGTVSEMSVLDAEGDPIAYEFSDANEYAEVVIAEDLDYITVEYELGDALSKKDGAWVWDVNHPRSIKFAYPDGVELVFINETPIYVGGESDKIRCHGCDMYMTYSIDEPEHSRTVNWEGSSFDVKIGTLGEVGRIDFRQGEKSISFGQDGGHFITVKIPQELLWNPYRVWIGEEQILNHEIAMDGGTVWLTFRPAEPGTVTIVGMSVVPEIPSGALVLVMVVGTAAAVVAGKRFLPSRP